eukprot:181826-Rhodomonas_salina.2
MFGIAAKRAGVPASASTEGNNTLPRTAGDPRSASTTDYDSSAKTVEVQSFASMGSGMTIAKTVVVPSSVSAEFLATCASAAEDPHFASIRDQGITARSEEAAGSVSRHSCKECIGARVWSKRKKADVGNFAGLRNGGVSKRNRQGGGVQTGVDLSDCNLNRTSTEQTGSATPWTGAANAQTGRPTRARTGTTTARPGTVAASGRTSNGSRKRQQTSATPGRWCDPEGDRCGCQDDANRVGSDSGSARLVFKERPSSGNNASCQLQQEGSIQSQDQVEDQGSHGETDASDRRRSRTGRDRRSANTWSRTWFNIEARST